MGYPDKGRARRDTRIYAIIIGVAIILLSLVLVPGLSFLILATVIFLPALTWLLLWPRRMRTRALQGFIGNNDALDTLRERYARGEITQDQFETMKRDLED